jgi:hypothetical protein
MRREYVLAINKRTLVHIICFVVCIPAAGLCQTTPSTGAFLQGGWRPGDPVPLRTTEGRQNRCVPAAEGACVRYQVDSLYSNQPRPNPPIQYNGKALIDANETSPISLIINLCPIELGKPSAMCLRSPPAIDKVYRVPPPDNDLGLSPPEYWAIAKSGRRFVATWHDDNRLRGISIPFEIAP